MDASPPSAVSWGGRERQAGRSMMRGVWLEARLADRWPPGGPGREALSPHFVSASVSGNELRVAAPMGVSRGLDGKGPQDVLCKCRCDSESGRDCRQGSGLAEGTGHHSGLTGQGGVRLEGWPGGWVCRAAGAGKKWASGDTASDSRCSSQARFRGSSPTTFARPCILLPTVQG